MITRSEAPPRDARDGDVWLKCVPPAERGGKVDVLFDVAQAVAPVLAGLGLILAVIAR